MSAAIATEKLYATDGAREIVIQPRLVGDLTSAKGSCRSPQWLIRASGGRSSTASR